MICVLQEAAGRTGGQEAGGGGSTAGAGVPDAEEPSRPPGAHQGAEGAHREAQDGAQAGHGCCTQGAGADEAQDQEPERDRCVHT